MVPSTTTKSTSTKTFSLSTSSTRSTSSPVIAAPSLNINRNLSAKPPLTATSQPKNLLSPSIISQLPPTRDKDDNKPSSKLIKNSNAITTSVTSIISDNLDTKENSLKQSTINKVNNNFTAKSTPVPSTQISLKNQVDDNRERKNEIYANIKDIYKSSNYTNFSKEKAKATTNSNNTINSNNNSKFNKCHTYTSGHNLINYRRRQPDNLYRSAPSIKLSTTTTSTKTTLPTAKLLGTKSTFVRKVCISIKCFFPFLCMSGEGYKNYVI